MYEQVQAGHGGGAGTRAHQLDGGNILANHFQAVQNGGRRNNGGTVLVVVEDGDLHALAQLLLDIEAPGRLDVFEVNAAKSRFERRNNIDEFVGVGFVQLNVEYIDAGKFFEQAAFAFHNGLGRQRANIAQTKHGGTVGNDAHQIGARGVHGGGFFATIVNGHAG